MVISGDQHISSDDHCAAGSERTGPARERGDRVSRGHGHGHACPSNPRDAPQTPIL